MRRKEGLGLVIVWIVAGVVLLAVELHHFALYILFVGIGCFLPGGRRVDRSAVPAQVPATVVLAVVGILLSGQG